MAEVQTAPALRPENRQGSLGLGQWTVLGGTAVAVAVTVALIATWPSHSGSSPPAAATNPSIQVDRCAPIVGTGPSNSGEVYPVTSAATKARPPAGCADARAVLLTALNDRVWTVGGWHCKRSPNRRTLAACTSGGGRRIVARN